MTARIIDAAGLQVRAGRRPHAAEDPRTWPPYRRRGAAYPEPRHVGGSRAVVRRERLACRIDDRRHPALAPARCAQLVARQS